MYKNRIRSHLHKNVRSRIKIFKVKRIPRVLKYLLIFFGVIIFTLAISAIIFSAWFVQYTHDLPEITSDTFKSVQTTGLTRILDRNEKQLYTLSGDKVIDFIPVDQEGSFFKWSIIAAEDTTFYQNEGIELQAIIRAAISNSSNQNGQQLGASTISQQTVKNLITGSEKTTERKVKESVLAMELNRRYSKDKILEIYTNLIPMGGVNYGIKRGANLYFGKDPKDLTLAEAAYLAGVPQQPSEYAPSPIGRNTPVQQTDGSTLPSGIDRQHYVLHQLEKIKDQAGITQVQINEAFKEPIHFVNDFDKVQIKAPHFVNYVREQLDEIFKDQGGEDYVRKANLTVTTTLDLDVENAAEDTAKSMDSRLPSVYDSAIGQNQAHLGANNVGIVTLDSRNGDILAMVGSKDFFADASEDRKFDPQTNFTISPRSMGSTMKPCMYLASMVYLGFTPTTITPNVTDNDGKSKQVFGGGYRPQNYTPIPNVNEDKLTMRDAIQRSLNIPAIFTLSQLGLKNYADFCGKMGYDQEEQNQIKQGLSTVLGSAGISIINHTNVFATMANNGVRNDTTVILEIKDKDGNIIYSAKRNPKYVVAPQYIKMMNSILVDYPFGSLTRMWNAGFYGKVAGKTGTSDISIQRDRKGNPIKAPNGAFATAPSDVTFAGYTGSIATTITVGNSNNWPLASSADGASVATTLWADYMLKIINKYPTPVLNR